MPQLDASTFPSQLFWLTISFVILYVLLARVLLPRVQSVIGVRVQTVGADIEQAERLKSEAARAAEQYERALVESRAKSQEMLVLAQAQIAERAAKRQAELDATLEKKLGEADASIRAARQNVSEKLTPVAAELASLIVEVLVHQKPAAQDISSAISEVAKERSL